MKKGNLVAPIAALMRDVIPESVRGVEQAGREAVQISIWLVGLSAGFLTLLAANDKLLPLLGSGSASFIIRALLITVVSGILHRILYLSAESHQRSLVHELTANLAGKTLSIEVPDDIDSAWDAPDILRRLRDDFDLDYSWLLQSNPPIAMWREVYHNHYVTWKDAQQEALDAIADTTTAHLALPQADGRRWFNLDNPHVQDLTKVRRKAKVVKGLWNASLWIYLIGSLSFLAAIIALASALLSRSAAMGSA